MVLFLVLGRFIFCCWSFEAFFKQILPSMNFFDMWFFWDMLNTAITQVFSAWSSVIVNQSGCFHSWWIIFFFESFCIPDSPFKGMLRSTRSNTRLPRRWVPSCWGHQQNTYPNQPTNQPTAGSRKGQNRVVSISRLELLQTASWWAKGKGTAMIEVDPKNILNVGWLEMLKNSWER